jgi:hypothetical protein
VGANGPESWLRAIGVALEHAPVHWKPPSAEKETPSSETPTCDSSNDGYTISIVPVVLLRRNATAGTLLSAAAFRPFLGKNIRSDEALRSVQASV